MGTEQTYSAIDIIRMPDPWQVETLESPSRCILRNCARQVGKTTVAAAAALKGAMEGSDVMVKTPSKRQSDELARAVAQAVLRVVNIEGGPGPRWEKGLFRLETGSISVTPGYTGPQRPVDLLVIDDAARAGFLDIVRAHWVAPAWRQSDCAQYPGRAERLVLRGLSGC